MTRNGTETRKGQDRETGLGAKHDGPVAATSGDAPNLSGTTPKVERVARAICVVDEGRPDDLLGHGRCVWQNYEKQAAAAIAAMNTGERVTAITDEMIEAGIEAAGGSRYWLSEEKLAAIYLAMSKVADQSPAPLPNEVERVAKMIAEDIVNGWDLSEDADENAYEQSLAAQTEFFRPVAQKIITAIRGEA